MAYSTGAETDKGQRRKANEDSMSAPNSIPWPAERECVYCAVADGVGGAVGGAVASSTAIQHFTEHFSRDTAPDPEARLRAAVESANTAVIRRSSVQPELQGMATTMVAAAAIERRIWYANVGDSRGYLWQSGQFYQVSVDHSLVSDAVRAGFVAPEEAGTRPERHVINRSLGTNETVDVDCFGPLRFMRGDIALLCSDGLHDVIQEGVIVDVLLGLPPDQAARELVRLANEAGGPDNITVVVLAAT